MRILVSGIRRSAFAVLMIVAIAMTSCMAEGPVAISQVVVPTWRVRLPYQITGDGISLAWHALVISDDTYVVYSLSSENVSAGDVPLTPVQAHLRYKTDGVVPFSEATSVDFWDDVSLGVLRFPGPPQDAEIVELEIEDVQAQNVVLRGRWDLDMIYDTAPESDAYTLMPLWTPDGPIAQGSFDVVTSVVYPQFNAEFDVSNAGSAGSNSKHPETLPTSTPPMVAADNELLPTLIVQGINPATKEMRTARIQIDRDGKVYVDPANGPAPTGHPDDQSMGDSLSDLADDVPPQELTLDEAVARSPVAIWERTGLDSDVHLQKVTMVTFAQPDDAVILVYSDGISLGQHVVPPGVDMADQMAISDAVDVRTFDLNGTTVSGIAAGSAKSVITGEQIPYKGVVWWERDGVFHSVTGDATFEALAAIAKEMRPVGE